MIGHPLAVLIASYVDERKLLKLEDAEKTRDKALKSAAQESECLTIESDYQQTTQEVEETYRYTAWLTDAAKRAGQISLATHAVKFIHSEARGSSVLLDNNANIQDKPYLSSYALTEPAIDAVGNAAALDCAKLLQLEVNGKALADYLLRQDDAPFRAFSADEAQLKQWMEGFSQALTDTQLRSHTLAKQIYFPLENGEYHLLSPLFSSALAQVVHQKITHVRYSEESKAIRDTRRKQKYHPETDVRFTDTAIQNFGGSKPQNISQLNSSRGGRAFLFRCAPPRWRSLRHPPYQLHSIFSARGEFALLAASVVRQLRTFLEKNRDVNDKDIRRERKEYVNEIIDILFNYAAEVQAMTAQRSWSQRDDCKLERAQCLWLDPYCKDEAFIAERESGDWQKAIEQQFAFWLNSRLNDNKSGLLFEKAESNEWRRNWRRNFREKLRDFELDLPEETA